MKEISDIFSYVIQMEPLPDLSSLSTSGGPYSARPRVNPFIMPEGSDRFQYREEENQRQRAELATFHRMSLVQRTDMLTPRIPPCISKATMKVHEPGRTRAAVAPRARPDVVKPVQPEAPNTAKNMRMTEFVAQKREIFLVQLLIERKTKEMTRLENEMRAEEHQLLETENSLAETSNQYKMATAQAEASLARARKAVEAATKNRVELQKEYKLLQQTSSIIHTEISKNRDTLESYRQYFEFLKTITPEGRKMEDFYASPKLLETEMDNLEKENLFLIDQYEALKIDLEKGENRESEMLSETNEQLKKVQARLAHVPKVEEIPEIPEEADHQASEALDKELETLNNLIKHTYLSCFHAEANISAMMMLERIENALEGLYEQMEYVDPEFAGAKQKKKDYERAEERRAEESRRKEAEQRMKIEHALERATRPIKKRTGRPIMRRMLPIKIVDQDDEQYRAYLKEQQRIETLLYGEDSD